MPLLFSILRIVLWRDRTHSGITGSKDMNYFFISLSANVTSENWSLLTFPFLLFLIAHEVEIMFIRQLFPLL